VHSNTNPENNLSLVSLHVSAKLHYLVLTLRAQHMFLIYEQIFPLLPPRRLPVLIYGENVSLDLNRTSRICKINSILNVLVCGWCHLLYLGITVYSAAEQRRYLYKPAKRLLLSCPPSCLRPQQRRIPKENYIQMPYRESTYRQSSMI